MRSLGAGVVLLALCFFGCGENSDHKAGAKAPDTIKAPVTSNSSNDKEEIQDLIRKMLQWANTDRSINLLPAVEKDSICIGFDMNKLGQNLDKLRETGFFAEEFIENYNQIIRTLDKKVKNNEFVKWNVYELPTFAFSNDVDPWCLCQDVPYDSPDPYGLVEIQVIKLNDQTGELYWNWGKLKGDNDPSWKESKYKFNVKKENGKWKISYLQGFDYKYATQKDGL